SDVEKIMEETNTGNYFNYNDYDSLKRIILVHYKSFQNNSLQSHPIGLQKYHRKALTKSLANLL
ncbi:MAG: glycosyl transferase family 1, partial [Algibacter sp.]